MIQWVADIVIQRHTGRRWDRSRLLVLGCPVFSIWRLSDGPAVVRWF